MLLKLSRLKMCSWWSLKLILIFPLLSSKALTTFRPSQISWGEVRISSSGHFSSTEDMMKLCAIWSSQLIILLSENSLELSEEVYLGKKCSFSLPSLRCEHEKGYFQCVWKQSFHQRCKRAHSQLSLRPCVFCLLSTHRFQVTLEILTDEKDHSFPRRAKLFLDFPNAVPWLGVPFLHGLQLIHPTEVRFPGNPLQTPSCRVNDTVFGATDGFETALTIHRTILTLLPLRECDPS